MDGKLESAEGTNEYENRAMELESGIAALRQKILLMLLNYSLQLLKEMWKRCIEWQ